MAVVSGWLAEGADRWGGRPVARTVDEAGPRQRALLTGTVRTVGLRRRSGTGVGLPRAADGPSQALATEADLDDGTGTVTLRWVGRDHLPGVVVGATLVVEGTVLEDRGHLVLLNPLYRFAHSSSSW